MGADFDTGQQFGAYRLGKLIGRGGMGVVYQAEHVHLQRVVALKLLAPDLSQNEDFRARFLRESRVAAALDHPAIVNVYDAGDVNGVLYIAMRFVRGTDLSQVLAERGPLGPDETLTILAQIADALDAAHREDLVHRDVKPANVMIEGERCYLADFGLTKRVSKDSLALTSAGQFLGTVDYVAPEQVEGGDCDGRTDQYALGCVLYECLTGARPYPRDAQVAIIYGHLREPPPKPTDVRRDLPGRIDGVIARAMAKRPDDRYPTCGAMIAAAREVFVVRSPPPVTVAPAVPQAVTGVRQAPPAPPPPAPAAPLPAALTAAQARPAPAQSRSRTPIFLAAAVLAVVALIALLLVLRGGDEEEGANTAASGGAASGSGTADGPRVAAKFAVGERPFGVVVSEGYVWVANNSDDTVSRIDPDDGARKDIPVGDGPFDLARGDGVWVGNSLDGTVTRIDPASGDTADAVPVGTDPYFLTVQRGRLFVANGGDDRVQELDASSGAADGVSVDVGDAPRGVAPSKHAIWVANSGDGTVSQIVRGEVADTVRVGDNPVGIAFGDDAIWVANKDSDTVSRIVAPAGAEIEVTNVEVGDAPFGIGFGEGYVWVTNSGDDTVMRLDPRSGEVVGEPISVPGQPVGVTADEGAVWVTSNDANTVTRIDP